MSDGLFLAEKPRVLRVAELARSIKELLESNVPMLWVRGEISNFVRAASGHWYFSLKDEQAQVRCVMFRHKNQILLQGIGNGAQIEVQAVATLYEARGDFQLTVEQLRPAGLGVLYEQFAQLKQKLEDEGVFAVERKRALPAATVSTLHLSQIQLLDNLNNKSRQMLFRQPIIHRWRKQEIHISLN